MKHASKILLLLIFQTTGFLAQLEVKNYFSVTGKKDVPVNVIVQDFDGYLILGTTNGVYKFDGRSSTEIQKESKLLKKNISALFIDSRGKLWIGTFDGKVYTQFQSQFDSVQYATENTDFKITSFCEGKNGILIGTYGNGLYAINNGAYRHVTSKQGLSDDVVYKIICDKNNTLWAGTDAGICEIVSRSDSFSFTTISNKLGLPDNIVRDLQLVNGKLLIAMQDSGICYFNLEKRKIEKTTFFSNWTKGAVVNAHSVNSTHLIIGNEKNELLNINNGIVSVYNYQNTIHNAKINQLFIDREQQIWLASQKGISHVVERRFHLINKSNGLTDEKVLALAMDNDNTLWIGTTNGISKIMRDDKGEILVEKLDKLQKYTISCATKAPDGTIWFGTYGNGIVILSSEDKNCGIINAANHGLVNDNISNIYFSNSGTVYISTLGGGLVKAKVDLSSDKKLVEVEKVYTQQDGLGSDYIYSALTDNNGNLFVGSDGGGLQLLENGKFVNLTKKFKLQSNNIFSLCNDIHNHIWASSNADGVLRYDGKSISSMNLSTGLRDEQPQQLLATGNEIYAVNSKGIDNINCMLNSVNYYDLYEEDVEPNLNALCFVDKTLYIGTNSGILSFRTGKEKTDSIKPKIFIKTIYVNFKPIAFDSLFEFKHSQNNFSIAFDGIWLKNPGKLVYRYKLVGIETDWQYSNEGKSVSYNNLGPGNYTFIVQVKNEEDVWSDPEGYAFMILTPIWKRWWFWLLITVVVVILIVSFVRYRLRALQKENILLEEKVKERTFEIEKQSKIIELKNIELEQLSLVASKTDNVVLILDPNGKLEYINESFEKLNGISMDELIKTYGDNIYDLSNNDNIREIINDAIQNKRSVNYESLNKKLGEGVELWESSTLTPIFDETGALKKIIIIDTDVTVRKKQEQIIFQKNKDITDSIYYARKIQQAILPNNRIIKSNLKESFILYMTKDIVSGDFYWFSSFKDFCIIAAVDCTGHGVPGAFMSLIGYNILNKIVNEQKIQDPKEILFELNKGVLAVLHQNDSESKDGMDIAICKINFKSKHLEYAGAMRPLWIIHENGELTEVKADKIPIGTKAKDREHPIEYTTHLIPYKKGDTFYIFTDGYADQFGGEKDKKYSTGKFKQLLQSIHKEDFNTQEIKLKEEHIAWKRENEQVDDILVIGFKL